MVTDLRDLTTPESAVRAALNLEPHPEGGHYREVWRELPATGQRGSGSSILFMLAEGERSHWHRVDATEIWIWQAGAALSLSIANSKGAEWKKVRLGPELGSSDVLQGVVPAYAWQSAESLGRWTLVSCIVAPAFEYAGFEIAPVGWSPTT